MNQVEYRQVEDQMKRIENRAFILGIGALVSTLFFPIVAPCLLGSMAVVFAVLSKGGNLKFNRRNRIAMLLGLAAIIVNVFYLGFTLRTIHTMMSDPSGRQQLNDLLYQQYGMSLDDLPSELFSLPFFR